MVGARGEVNTHEDWTFHYPESCQARSTWTDKASSSEAETHESACNDHVVDTRITMLHKLSSVLTSIVHHVGVLNGLQLPWCSRAFGQIVTNTEVI